MSRSAFAARFTVLAGESPFRYLTTWRLKKAVHLLLRGNPIAAVASAVGYDTDTAFGKAFKKYAGVTPGEFRRQAHASEASHPQRIAS
jgi:AraC-like DNA-binding protein